MITVKHAQRRASFGAGDMLELMRSPDDKLKGSIITGKIAMCMDILKEFAMAAMVWNEQVMQPSLWNCMLCDATRCCNVIQCHVMLM
jgi:hypothetical protein